MDDITEWTAERTTHRIVEGYDRGRRELWDREYSSIAVYRASISPNSNPRNINGR